MRKVVVSFKLTPALRDRLNAWHEKTRVPKAVAAEEALTAYLDEAERAEATTRKKGGRK